MTLLHGHHPAAICPTLETPRLRLRAHTLTDLKACATMWSHPDVFRYIGGRAFSTSETWSKILRYAGHWELLGFGYWLVEDKVSGDFVGEMGFANFMRAIDSSLNSLPELGWALTPKAHGQGFALEALTRILAWADNTFRDPRTWCLIDPANSRSRRLAEKCGYKERGRISFNNDEVVIFQRESIRHNDARV